MMTDADTSSKMQRMTHGLKINDLMFDGGRWMPKGVEFGTDWQIMA